MSIECSLGIITCLPVVRTTGDGPNDRRWLELARVIENLAGQVQALADAESPASERVTVFEQTAHQIQDVVAGLAQGQGPGAGSAGECWGSTLFIGKNMVPERLTNNTGFEQWDRGCKLVAVATDERLKVLLERVEALQLAQPF